MGKRVERTRAGNTWTEARYFGWIRSQLRGASRKWPPIYQVLKDARRKSQSSNKRLKWEYNCACCDGWFPKDSIQVDHKIPCGSLKTFEDLPGFCERLFCEPSGLQCVCVECHKEKTHGP